MRWAFATLMLGAAIGFAALGIWQVERLAWKRELIAQTEARLAAAPVMAPAPDAWAGIDSKDVYTRVVVTGRYMAGKDVYVVASTQYGRGYWVMTPLVTNTSFTVIVNRGFVESSRKGKVDIPEGIVTVNGLLRLTEPKGSLLQKNRPDEGRWYSRDVSAIAKTLGVEMAPYFIDAGAGDNGGPVGGLTVVKFPNNHLQYALTWFGLAGLALFGLVMVLRHR